VIRGQEFISSMPNYLALYEALDLEHPIFAHMPHIMNEQGNKKLGKRDGAKDVLDYIRDGYLPEALDSFIATMGWNDGTEQEVFTMDELIEKFSLTRVQRSGARFDEKRLLWVNGHFIRELSIDELYRRVEFFWPDSSKKAPEDYKKRVLGLAQDRLKTLKDLPTLTNYFFEEPVIDISLLTDNKQLSKLSAAEQADLLQTVHDAFVSDKQWTNDSIQQTLNELLETTGQKPGTLFSLVRIATTWAPFSPQLNDTLMLLGKDKTLLRLSSTIDHLK
ncbi:glutamate--tRNA ligase, partial [Candidatus Saccharibacteria bacterium]|nr:glutamate--tRNA ligase [Candidatus Saccharibacteria bacterium]